MTAAPLAPSARLTVGAAETWTTLGSVPPDGVFDPSRLDGHMPEPTRRWLAHSIAPGTPLAHAASLEMTGEIRIGKWRSFRATQVIAPAKGYVWAATTRFSLFPVTGFDRYSEGAGEMRWRMARVVPFGSGRDENVTLSAAGRLATELALLPTAFDVATWESDGPGASSPGRRSTVTSSRSPSMSAQTGDCARCRAAAGATPWDSATAATRSASSASTR